MKRLLLLSLISVLILTSCGDTSQPETTTAVETDAETTESDDYGYIDPGLEKKDYNGKIFNILYPEWSLYMNYYFADEANGEVVNDAVYERLRRVEEFFNIDFEWYSPGYVDSVYPELQKVVTAGLPEYDLVLTHCATSLTGYVTEGLICNWIDMPGVDLEKPYWNQSVRENFEVKGVLPFMASDYILPDVNSIFFNKDLIAEYSLDDPYALVEDGSWTWEKLNTMATVASRDLNGDNIMDEQDQYGFVGERDWQFSSVMTSCGQLLFGKNDEGIPEVICDNEKTQSILDMICNLIYRDNTSYTWAFSVEYDINSGGRPPVAFDNNRSLFYLTPLSLATTYREAEVNYGIVPLPKYDEEQDDYITLNWSGFMCVPATVEDLECVGMVCEMLAAESCHTVIPAFYDVLLGEKIALDPTAKEMLDIIFDDTVYDLGVDLSQYHIVYSQIASDSPNNSAYLAANLPSIEKTIEDYVEGCEGYLS